MRAYLDLLARVRREGLRVPTRARLQSTGRQVDALTCFGAQLRVDLRDGFPAVTTKRLAFDALAHELIWFLRGSTNITYLTENRVKIWDEWADADGELGPVYGKQWRSWAAPDGRVVDQFADVLAGIRASKVDPAAAIGRRLIVTAWNPADVPSMALPPCHLLFQFRVLDGRLHCQLYQRSADLFLGVPFNIASYALLTHLVAHVTGLAVGDFVHTFGDVHIYANHLDQVDEQLSRAPLPLPGLWVDPSLADLDHLRRDQFALVDYRHHPTIRGEVAV